MLPPFPSYQPPAIMHYWGGAAAEVGVPFVVEASATPYTSLSGLTVELQVTRLDGTSFSKTLTVSPDGTQATGSSIATDFPLTGAYQGWVVIDDGATHRVSLEFIIHISAPAPLS